MLGWLVHPLPLAAIALTAINDHVLKGSGLLPAWLTLIWAWPRLARV